MKAHGSTLELNCHHFIMPSMTIMVVVVVNIIHLFQLIPSSSSTTTSSHIPAHILMLPDGFASIATCVANIPHYYYDDDDDDNLQDSHSKSNACSMCHLITLVGTKVIHSKIPKQTTKKYILSSSSSSLLLLLLFD